MFNRRILPLLAAQRSRIEQNIFLFNAWFDNTQAGGIQTSQWLASRGNHIPMDPGFTSDGSIAYLRLLRLRSDSRLQLVFTDGASSTTNKSLSAAFGRKGGFTITTTHATGTVRGPYTFLLDGTDLTSPYLWRPSNSADLGTLYAGLRTGRDGSTRADVTFFIDN